jgi:hypothetical protein
MGNNPQPSASKQASSGDFDRLETLLKNLPGMAESEALADGFCQ